MVLPARIAPEVKLPAMRGVNAWIVRWDYASDSAKEQINDPDRVWIFNGRLVQKQVLALVEQIYIDRFFTVVEQLSYARRGKWYRHMRQHLYSQGTLEGVPYEGQFTFGRHPYLEASLSRDVRVVLAEDGSE